MSVPAHAKLSPVESVLTRTVGDEMVLLNLSTEYYFGLDPVGAAMWQAICDTGTLTGAQEVLSGVYDVETARVGNDLRDLVEQLVEHHLLEVADE